MIGNPNDLINSLKTKSIKTGYDLKDKSEFSTVRKILVDFGLSTVNFDNNLKTLIIDESSKSIGYNPKSNTIYGIKKGVELIHELFHMSSNKNNGDSSHGAYSSKGYGKSLNEGFVDYLTFITNNANYRSVYSVEESYADFLKELYGDELLQKFIEGDVNNFYNSFGNDRSEVVLLTKLLDVFTNRMIQSRDIMFDTNFEGSKVDAISECYDKAFDALLVFVIKLVNYYKKKDSARVLEYLNDIEDIIYYNYKSDVEASKYRSFDNYIKLIENNIKNLDRGV